MKSVVYFACLLILVGCCIGVGAAAYGASHTPHPLQEHNAQETEDDHVYSSNEVDVKAKITNKMENLPEPGKDCPNRAGLVRLKIILHKSGKVTGVTVIKGLGCSYDEATAEAARKFTFTPAVKDGKQVSQYQIFEYQYRGI
jgi:TonB family protein